MVRSILSRINEETTRVTRRDWTWLSLFNEESCQRSPHVRKIHCYSNFFAVTRIRFYFCANGIDNRMSPSCVVCWVTVAFVKVPLIESKYQIGKVKNHFRIGIVWLIDSSNKTSSEIIELGKRRKSNLSDNIEPVGRCTSGNLVYLLLCRTMTLRFILQLQFTNDVTNRD